MCVQVFLPGVKPVQRGGGRGEEGDVEKHLTD